MERSTPQEVKRAVLDFIERPGDRDAAALWLYRWQVENIPAYGRFAAGAEPQTLEEIPAVPVGLMRDVRFCCTDSPQLLFRTSGTTAGRRGEHAMPDPEVYDLSVKRWLAACLPACPIGDTLSLVNPLPDSSLGHMIRALAPGASWFFHPERGVDGPGAWEALQRAERPVFLAATAFALAELFERWGERVVLPEGSVVMVTGGFKGRRSELDAPGLASAIPARLGPVQAVGEYGMTELSSPLWDTGGGFMPAPWLHVYTVDPLKGRPVEGEGLLRFVDLANWGSVLAIETQDLGWVSGGRVHLSGRLSGAPPRGCSLSAEEARWTFE